MSNLINITIEAKNLDNIAEKMTRAEHRAVKKTLAQTRTFWVKNIHKELNLPANTIKKATYTTAGGNRSGGLVVIDSSKAGLGVKSHAKKRSLPLTAFGAVQNARGVRVKIKRKGAPRLIKSAFYAGVLGGRPDQTNRERQFSGGNGYHRGVFIRLSKERYPIKELRSTSIEDVGADNLQATQAFADKTFERLYFSQLKYELSK